MSDRKEKELPKGWAKAAIGEILTLINGRAFKPDEWEARGLPIIRIQNLNNEEAPFNYSTTTYAEKFKVIDGDLLFAWSGTPGTSFGAHIWKRGEAWLNQHIFKVEFYEGVLDSRFLRDAINQNLTAYIRQAHGGAGLAHITKSKFEESELLIAPLAEQTRIADKLDELLSDLDAGVAALEGVRAKLKHYRTAVLKAAVEGALTAQWREQNPATESAADLLTRILAERRHRWEETQLQKFKDQGKAPPKDWKAKYKEPLAPNTANLAKLPEGWCWASPEQLAAPADYSLAIGPFGSNLKVSDYTREGAPLIFVRNIRAETFGDSKSQFVSMKKAEELRAHKVYAGDLLVTKMGDPPGDVCLYPQDKADAILTADCIKVTLSPLLPAHPYFVFAIRSPLVKAQIALITKGVAQMKVSLGRFASIALPLAPTVEQKAIVESVETQISVIDHLEADLEEKLKSAQALRQAILRDAFEGKLVPQDPNDEPASELLKRIASEREERAKAAKIKKSTSTKKRAAQKTASP